MLTILKYIQYYQSINKKKTCTSDSNKIIVYQYLKQTNKII